MDPEDKGPVVVLVLVEGHVSGCDCPRTDGTRDGPAKVTTEKYRAGWDSVFGARMPVGQA